MFLLIHVHVGTVTEVHEHVEEILCLCGEASVSGKESLELLRCVCVCVCVCAHARVHCPLFEMCVCVCVRVSTVHCLRGVCVYVCVSTVHRLRCVCVCMCVCVCVHCPLFTVVVLCIYSCKGVKIHGTTYKQGSVIRITSNDEQGDLPFIYAQIVHVYVYQDYKIFITNILSISDFVNNLRAINVDVTSNSLVCLSTQLYSHGVLHIKQHAHSSYIIEKDHWAKHTLFY